MGILYKGHVSINWIDTYVCIENKSKRLVFLLFFMKRIFITNLNGCVNMNVLVGLFAEIISKHKTMIYNNIEETIFELELLNDWS